LKSIFYYYKWIYCFLFFLYSLYVFYLCLFSLKFIYFSVKRNSSIVDLVSKDKNKFLSFVGFCLGVLIVTYYNFGVVSSLEHVFFCFKFSKVYWSENQLLNFGYSYILNTFELEISKRLFEVLPELVANCGNNIQILQLELTSSAVKIQQELFLIDIVPSKLAPVDAFLSSFIDYVFKAFRSYFIYSCI